MTNNKTIFETYNSIIIIDRKNLLPIDENETIMVMCIVDDENFELSLKYAQFIAQAFDNDCDIAFFDINVTLRDLEEIDKSIFSDTLFIIFNFLTNGTIPLAIQEYIKLKGITNNIIYICQNTEEKLGIFNFGTVLKVNNISLDSIAAVIMHLSGRKP